jgi:mannose-6-phosphate isomerase-like protein (cupin superfamily)
MSLPYPPARYHGTGGEVTARFRPADHPPDLEVGPTNRVHYLATGASTAGQFGLYRWDAGPRTPGPAPHFHRTISESFFVLSGTVRLFDGERRIDATAGEFLFVPQGGIHAFENATDEPYSMLLLFAPGAPREGYFEALADLASGRRQFTPEEWTALCEHHDNYFV